MKVSRPAEEARRSAARPLPTRHEGSGELAAEVPSPGSTATRPSKRDSADAASLTSEEQRILNDEDDHVSTYESCELFSRVRLEEAQRSQDVDQFHLNRTSYELRTANGIGEH